jgi:hypothetical protein
LGLDLSAMGRGLGTTGYAAAQVWYHAELEGISPGHLVDLERRIQRTVDGQPPHSDGAATGWFQDVFYRILAGRPADWGFGLLAPKEHLVARGAKWATKLVDSLCPPVLHVPCQPPPPPPPILLPEPEELPGGVRPMADQPVCSGAQTTSAAAGPLSPVPGWVGMARVALLRVCPSLYPLQTLLSAAFCAPEAVVSGLLSVARDQRLLVPVSALRRMLLAIACLGHIQQRPGSDLPQLWAGELHWLTLPGLSAVEIFEVKSHLVWTHQTTYR